MARPSKAFEVLRVAQIAVAEFLGDHAGLHDRGIEQIAPQHQEAGVLHQRLVVAPDHVVVGLGRFAAVLAHAAAVHRDRVLVDALVLHQFAHHGRHAAGAVEFLAEIEAGRLHVDQQRHVVAELLPVVDRQLDADVARQRVDVDRRVGRAADRRIDHDAVLERLAGQDVRRLEVFPDHLDDALAGLVGDLAALAIGRGDRRAARQREAERFGKPVHGRGGAHGVAMADRGRRGGHDLHEFLIVDLAGGEPLARLPDDGAGAGALAVMPAVQHRSARQHDRGQVDGRRRHHAGGRGLVAAGGQHHAVERIAVEDLDQAEIGEVAVERRGRALAGLLDRMGREFHRNAAGLADAFADAVRQLDMVAVAGGKVVAGLGDADDRLAGLQLGPGQAVIQIALEIERGHARIMRIVEPFLRAEVAASAVAGGACPLVGFFVIGFSCNANALASGAQLRLVRCPTARSMVQRPVGGSFPHKCDTSLGHLVTLSFCSRRPRLMRHGLSSERRDDELCRSITLKPRSSTGCSGRRPSIASISMVAAVLPIS